MPEVIGIEQILPEVLAQTGGNIAECAAAAAKFLEVEIDAHPFVDAEAVNSLIYRLV